MRIIPAIDVKDGKCVRLLKGDFDRVTEYSDRPVEIAERFAALDVTDLHIVDLDGAFEGEPINADVIEEISTSFPKLEIQIGGGIRSIETVEALL